MKALKTIFVAISFLISITAFAGEQQSLSVIIDLDAGVAQGSMWTARSSDDDKQMIGCARSIGEYEPPEDDFGYCHAIDADGVLVGCVFYDQKYYDAVSSINAYSYIKFGFDGGPGEYSNCTMLVVSAKSSYLPFTPIEKEKVK